MALVLTAALASPVAAHTNRAALRDLRMDGATVSDAIEWPPGQAEMDGTRPFNVAVPFCRVQLPAKPAAGSQIRIEVWLPQPARWNGRLSGIGMGMSSALRLFG